MECCDPSSMLALPLSLLRLSLHSVTETDCLDDPSASDDDDSTFCYNTEDYILHIDYNDKQPNRRRRSSGVARSEKSPKDDSMSTRQSSTHRRGSVSEMISLYERLDTTLGDDDDSQTTVPVVENTRHGKRSVSDRLALFEHGDRSQTEDAKRVDAKRVARSRRFSPEMPLHIRSKQPLSSVTSPEESESMKRGSEDVKPFRVTSLSPSKATRFVKRGKLWAKAVASKLEDQLVCTHLEGILNSPWQKPLPDTLKPSFHVFESAHSKLLHSAEWNTVEHETDIKHCSTPLSDLVSNNETSNFSKKHEISRFAHSHKDRSTLLVADVSRQLLTYLRLRIPPEQEHHFVFLPLSNSHKRNTSSRFKKRTRLSFKLTFKPFSDPAQKNELSSSPQPGDTKIDSESRGSFNSPRRKPLPNILKPAFNVFERTSTRCSKPEQELRFCSVPLLSLPERNITDRCKILNVTGTNLLSVPFSDPVQTDETLHSSSQLRDQQARSQSRGPLNSPRRKPLPDTLKLAFDVFESAHCTNPSKGFDHVRNPY